MPLQRINHAHLLVFCVLVAVLGCGGADNPDLGTVSGTVKMGNEPLKGAEVEFTPVEGGRPSVGTTNDDGYYELKYTHEAHGASIGKHKVRIRTAGTRVVEGVEVQLPERVPAKYNENTTLEEKVEAGENPINFDLEETGKIIQPEQDGQNSKNKETETNCF